MGSRSTVTSATNWPRILVALLVAATTLGGFASDARAQRKGKKDPAQEAKEQKEKQAYDLYQEGITHYNLGEFDAAIEKFKAAYGLTGAPGLLFNVAQAYRLKKDYEQALYFYKTYLRLDPDAPNKGDVEARIAEMEKMIQEQKQLDKAKPVGTIPPGGTGVPDPGPDKAPPGGGTIGTNPRPNPEPGPGTGTPAPPGGGTQIAAGGGGGDEGGSSVTGGTGVTGRYEPKGGTLGAIVRADIDAPGFKGAAFAVGVSYSFNPQLEAQAAVLLTGKFGASAGVTFLFSSGRLRPLAMLIVPAFFDRGTHVGVHAAVGLRYDLAANIGIELDLGAAHFFSAPTDDFKTTYFIPSVGIQGRL